MVLLVAVFGVAVFVSLRIYAGLAATASVERSLVAARQDLDRVLQLQIDQQNALRGYLLTRDDSFLAPYDDDDREFDVSTDRLAAETAVFHDAEIRSSVGSLRYYHERWESEVARPLMLRRELQVAQREATGKMLVDHLRGDAYTIGEQLQVRLEDEQGRLKRRIDESLISILALALVFGSAGIAFVASRSRLQAQIDRERAIVETLEGAFRNDLDALPGASIASAYSSATRDAAVGGDLYDVRRLDARTGLILVADVSGKGIEAAVDTAFVKYSLRTLARSLRDPAELLAEFNLLFLDTIRDPGSFVVAFAGIFDGSDRRLTYASAGHGGAFLRRGQNVRELDVTGPAIGLDASMTYERITLELEPGDLLVLATDGFTEARDPSGRMLGPRALDFVREAPVTPRACADALVEALRGYSGGGLADDLALLVVVVDGAPV